LMELRSLTGACLCVYTVGTISHAAHNISVETTHSSAHVCWLPAFDGGSALHQTLWSVHITNRDSISQFHLCATCSRHDIYCAKYCDMMSVCLSALTSLRYNMYFRTSGFTDDVMLSHRGASRPDSRTTFFIGRHSATVFG